MPQKFHFSQQTYIIKILQKYRNKQKILVIQNINNLSMLIQFYGLGKKTTLTDLNNFQYMLEKGMAKNSVVVFDNYSSNNVWRFEASVKPEYLIDNLSKKFLFYIFDFTKDIDYYNKFYELWEAAPIINQE